MNKPTRVSCYFNLHKQVFSVKQESLPVQHFDWLTLRSVSFHVSQSGRNRVLREKRKNVHAFVRGELVEGQKISLLEKVIPSFDSLSTRIRYNPYLYDYFFEDVSHNPIYEADLVLLYNKQVFKLK